MAYKTVPLYWSGLLTLAGLVLSIITIEVFDTNLSVWAFLVMIILVYPFAIAVSIIKGISGYIPVTVVLYEVLFNAMQPGKPIAALVFKGFAGGIIDGLPILTETHKLGHYMKIPPRVRFFYILYTTLLISVITWACINIMSSNLTDFCQPTQPHLFTCPGTRYFASATFLYSGVGLQRILGSGQMYVSRLVIHSSV